MKNKKALLSVTNKEGVVEFAKGLAALGYELLSTGGTYKSLREESIPVTLVEDYTNFKEMLEGRVKTLHPKIHGGILYKRGNIEHEKALSEANIFPIDLVCINLYDFESALNKGLALEDSIEEIDIGGPSLIRAAAKNFKDVTVVVDQEDYSFILKKLATAALSFEDRQLLACKAFNLTARYDSLIANYFNDLCKLDFPKSQTMALDLVTPLAYGENPHQKGFLFKNTASKNSLLDFKQLGGKDLSYNNLGDLYGGLNLLREFKETPTCVAIKHGTPCGVASSQNLITAYDQAYACDPLSIFGGVLVFNDEVTKELAEKLILIFLEIVAAPAFTDEALTVLKQKKNLRILHLNSMERTPKYDYAYLDGYVLMQDKDNELTHELQIVTDEKTLTPEDLESLSFGMKVVKGLKSNAIALVKGTSTVALCGGQTSRIFALKGAFNNSEGVDLGGAYLASDGFFPFSDCVEFAIANGIKAIIEPGGSLRDQDSIDECNKQGIPLVFTGMRHFRH